MSDAATVDAQALKTNPLLNNLLDRMEAEAIDAWKRTGFAQEDDRNRLWHQVKAVERLRAAIEGVIDDGKFAEAARRTTAPR